MPVRRLSPAYTSTALLVNCSSVPLPPPPPRIQKLPSIVANPPPPGKKALLRVQEECKVGVWSILRPTSRQLPQNRRPKTWTWPLGLRTLQFSWPNVTPDSALSSRQAKTIQPTPPLLSSAPVPTPIGCHSPPPVLLRSAPCVVDSNCRPVDQSAAQPPSGDIV